MNPPPKQARIETIGNIPPEWRGGVVAIGNFDGVHRGHQVVLGAARAEAERRGVACIMLTLEPHPRAYFSKRPLFRLTPPPLKAAAAAALGLDGVVVLPFDRALAEKSAEDFVGGVLVGQLRISAAVTGYDFHFGKDRRGNPDFLREQGTGHGFAVEVISAMAEGGQPVSSTRIRAALAEGNVKSANALLGWQFAVAAAVIHGDARGRQLGYPTANMALDPATELKHGVYAARFMRASGVLHDCVASYGRRPTFDNGGPLLETYLFDFSGDLYGETALVSLAAFIRREERFASAEDLVARMDQDAIEARAMLARRAPADLDLRMGHAWAGLTRL